jgi:hypothetical protein
MCFFAVLAIRGKGTFSSLAMAALLCCLQLLLRHSFAKRDYAAVERHLFCFVLARSVALICGPIMGHGIPAVHLPFLRFVGLWIRPLRSLIEPIRFRWVLTEMLLNLIGRYVAFKVFGMPLHLHWWLLVYVAQTLCHVFLRLHDRNRFLACDKSSRGIAQIRLCQLVMNSYVASRCYWE